MTGALSLYLDALRLGAALTVFLSHYGAGRISGGLMWQFQGYGHAAVLVFFVLSGFVIAAVADTRERSLEDYALSRAARLYSVTMPAIILTAALDWLGRAVDPMLYEAAPAHDAAHPALDYVLSAVFLGGSWTLTALPGFNVPYWSLNYEAWYYFLFAVAVFLHGGWRMTALGLAALLAGPKILLLLPIWLIGVACWRWRTAVPARCGWPLITAALGGLAVLQALGRQQPLWHASSDWLPPDYSAYDYAIGIVAAMLILGLANARLPMPSVRIQHAVRGLAETTFALYLLHFPLLNFFGAIVPGAPAGVVHRLLVFCLALGGGLGLGWLIEPQKRALKRVFYAVLGRRQQRALTGMPGAPTDSRSRGAS
jgi:peptidoglycan/LPS O-acetylase OafA/YrhL